MLHYKLISPAHQLALQLPSEELVNERVNKFIMAYIYINFLVIDNNDNNNKTQHLP